MRYVWTDAGDDPDLAVGDRHGINGYFMPCFDSVTTKPLLQHIQSRGHAIGLYVGHAWLNNLSPVEYARRASAEYERLKLPGLRMQFNLEEHDPVRIRRILEEWRKLRPTAGTSWTLEGMQGGWMDTAFVSAVIGLKVRVVPQCFAGNMERRAEDIVLRDLTRRGFPEALVTCMYDAAQLPADWDGYCFRMGRLP